MTRRAAAATVACVVLLGACSTTTARTTTSPVATVTAAAQTGTKRVVYQHIAITVPAAWPLEPGTKTATCGTWPTPPTAFVGPQPFAGISCPARSGQVSELDGVWLQAQPPPSGASTVTLSTGQLVLEDHVTPPGPGAVVYFHGASLQIGSGTPSAAAQEVLGSLSYEPAMPDTPVIGACATAPAAVLPAPRRLSQTLVLHQGTITLRPPAGTDQAAVAPPSTSSAAPGLDGTMTTTAQVFLARYSSTVPPVSDVLAWVVYSTPITPGCGLYGLSVVDAHTGQSLGSSGWTPGP